MPSAFRDDLDPIHTDICRSKRPLNSISPVRNKGCPLASKVLNMVNIPDACSKITSAVSGLVRQSLTA